MSDVKQDPNDLNDDELIALIVDAGTFTAAASRFGWLRDKFTRYISGRGVKEKADAALAEAREAAVTPEPAKQLSLDDEVSEEEKLGQRVKELEQQHRKVRQEMVFEERVLSRLVEAVPRISPKYEPLEFRPGFGDGAEGHEFGLLFSDLHAGEVVSSDEVLGLNSYNWEIMLERLAKVQRSVLSYQENRPYPVTRLNIWMLGDMLSGDIHEELSETNELPFAEATVQLAKDIAAWLEEFVPYFEHIHIAGVPGNHPRMKRKPQAKMAHNNADWIMYQMVAMQLAGRDEFSWNLPNAAFAVEEVASRWRMLLMHGDGIRTTMPGVPWGGITRRVTTLEQQFNAAKMPLDYVALGHFHTKNAIEGVGGNMTFVNGSVKGLDEYSLKQFGSGRPPGQVLLTFHEKHGWTDMSNIDLESVAPNGER